MNYRIRYSKLADGSWVSMRVIKGSEGKEYRAYIKPSGVEGYIEPLDGSTGVQVAATSAHKVKIGLKETLSTLGCEFVKESRGG